MKKPKEWACTEGCPITSTPCVHLEQLLPSMRDKKLVRVDVTNMSLDVFQVYRPSFSLGVFTEKMKGFGFLNEWDLALLTAKYYYGMSNRQITKEQNYCSPRTTDRRLKALHALLKERGFKPRRRKK